MLFYSTLWALWWACHFIADWLDVLSLSLPIKENAWFCSTHFCKEDFIGVEGYTASKPKLKSDAVPSLLLSNDPTFSKRRKITNKTVITQSVAPTLLGQLHTYVLQLHTLPVTLHSLWNTLRTRTSQCISKTVRRWRAFVFFDIAIISTQISLLLFM